MTAQRPVGATIVGAVDIIYGLLVILSAFVNVPLFGAFSPFTNLLGTLLLYISVSLSGFMLISDAVLIVSGIIIAVVGYLLLKGNKLAFWLAMLFALIDLAVSVYFLFLGLTATFEAVSVVASLIIMGMLYASRNYFGQMTTSGQNS